MNIKIPVHNNVEVIIADLFIKVSVGVHPMYPPETTEGKLAIERFEQVLNELAYKLASEIETKIQGEDDN